MKLLGFSIIEAVLSLALLAAGFIGLVLALANLSPDSLLVDQTTVAINLGRETLEKIIAQRDCNNTGCGYASTLTSINTAGTYNANPVSGFSGYVLSTTAVEVNPDSDGTSDDFLDAQASSNYARITTTVSWNNGNKSIKLATLLANY